jgi:pimeloyl-ACP methyl ester carboxylesterase
MPYADSNGVRINYRVEGTGPPLVLVHGFTESLESWYELGYVAALVSDYRLVLIDIRGHGASDKPHDPAAYALERRVGDVVAVLDTLGVGKAHFWGYSMGGWIGFGMARHAPRRVDRLVIGGMHPYARDNEGFRQLCRIGLAEGAAAFVAGVEQAFGPIWPGYKARLLAADFAAYLAMAQDRASLEDILPAIEIPCCLYAGGADPLYAEAERAAHVIRHAIFFGLPDLGHLGAQARSDLVLPQVRQFLVAGPTIGC